MKLGASYNIWDCEDLLESSIKSIRNNVDYISIVYQHTSNFGELNGRVERVVRDLLNKGIVDDITLYTTNKKVSASQNELNKRNTGLVFSKLANCTHHLSIDADEFYLDEQFKKSKEIIEKHDVITTACQMQTYWKSNNIVLNPPEDYYVPFIYKIKDDKKFVYNAPFYCISDPTRRMDLEANSSFYRFPRTELEMHHFSYVRSNIRQKLCNSSAIDNFRENIPNLVRYYNSWHFPQQALLAGAEDRYYDVKKVVPLFKL